MDKQITKKQQLVNSMKNEDDGSGVLNRCEKNELLTLD